ncbi:guanylate kinase [Candidatus Poribacteria bacterium]|nr:guanylate kinase [Candidatus Poribacteria bacterium]MBP96492.1 guanylate kinase [Candidatus Poribacteria bacterium]
MIEELQKQGRIIVVSGPSGVGKTTLVETILEHSSSIVRSVSATTRLPRSGETDGVDYHFLPKSEFERLIEQNGLVEWTKYGENYYGTLKSTLESTIKAGKDIVLTIDVDGAIQLKKLGLSCLLIFILPPSVQILRQRLEERKTETESELNQRLERAKAEFDLVAYYDYCVVNDQIPLAIQQLIKIIEVDRFRIDENLVQSIKQQIPPVVS